MALPFAAKISTDIIQVSIFEELHGLSLEISMKEENILHEACHVVTLGSGDETHQITYGVEKAIALLSGEASRNNELQTLAVEVLLLRRFGLLDCREDFLQRVLLEQWFTSPQARGALYLSCAQASRRIRYLEVLPLTQDLADQVLLKLEAWSHRWPA